MRLRFAAVLAAIAVVASAPQPVDAQADFLLLRFEQYLGALITQAGIPGLSAAIVEDQRIVWERGFGFQDVERRIPATPDTPYQVAGLTETFTAGLVLRCVESGIARLDDRMATYTTAIPETDATVAHVLEHTSAGTPGTSFRYDPARYASLGPVVEACSSLQYRVRLARAVLNRFAMIDSVPGQDVLDPAAVPPGTFETRTLDRYRGVLSRVAQPYRVDKSGRPTLSQFPTATIDAANGLISTVRDLARFDAALDDELVVGEPTLSLTWTNPTAPDGRQLPHALGWFVQTHNGQRIAWQFGLYRDASSSLILKLPDRHRTLILLANSDGLSASFRLSDGDVTTSLFAQLFLRLFS